MHHTIFFKFLLKATIVIGVFLTATAQSWGSGKWIRAHSGEDAAATEVPVKSFPVYLLTDGSGTDASMAISPTDAKAGKTLTLSMLEQSSAPTGVVTFTPTAEFAVIDLACSMESSDNVLPFTLANGDKRTSINLKKGWFRLNPSAGSGTGKVTVNIVESCTVILANEALAWHFIIPFGKTLTFVEATVMSGGGISGKGRTITPDNASCTLYLK